MKERHLHRRWIGNFVVLALAAATAVSAQGPGTTSSGAGGAPSKVDPSKIEGFPLSKPAPLFELAGLDGKTVKLADLKGKVVLLDFWATWCGPCRKCIPHLMSLYDQYKPEGLVVVGISIDRKGKDAVADFAKANKINYPIVMADSKTPVDYGGIRSIPTAFLVDQQGNIRRQYIGYQSKEVFERDIQRLLAPGT